jgi:hypothetical protein
MEENVDYLELINSIKDQYNEEWLTLSQKLLYEKVTTKFQAQKVINIFGDKGVGKTFLAWMITGYFNGYYTKDSNNLKKELVNVIDDFGYRKQDFRNLLPKTQKLNIKKTILISNKKIQDDITCFQLDFKDADKEKFKNNLWKFCKLEFPKEKDNMHSLIKFNIS